MMTRNIIWKGLNDESLEFFRINFGELLTVKSSIIGCSDDVPFKVDYELEMSKDWVISTFSIKAHLGNIEHALSLSHNGYGNWFNNGQEWKHLEGCLDIDISLTPFTNSLPLNRVKSGLDQKTSIEVVYIDVLDFNISKTSQYYQLLESNRYKYANSDGSFTADITVDEFNFVKHYPGLFERLLIKD
jgi:hypothetical protein